MVLPLRGEPKFPLGSLFFTPGAEACLSSFDVLRALCKHASGDWGDLESSDKQANDVALAQGTRLLSAYTAKNGTRFWVITGANRSSTTILLPHEY
jgi:hypothetical protein